MFAKLKIRIPNISEMFNVNVAKRILNVYQYAS